MSEELAQEAERRDGGVVLEKGKMVGAVTVAVKILNYLAQSSAPVGVTRIAQDLGLNASTTFNTLKTLAAHDYVNFHPLSKSYSIGLGLLHVTRSLAWQDNEFDLMRREIDDLARNHQVTLAVWQQSRADRKVLTHTFYPGPSAGVHIQMSVGQRLPLLIASSGRLFGAFGQMSREERQAQFRAIRWQSGLTYEIFECEVEQALREGYAVDQGDFVKGVVMISVPIFDAAPGCRAALSAMLFQHQFEQESAQPLIKAMQSVAQGLSQLRGHR